MLFAALYVAAVIASGVRALTGPGHVTVDTHSDFHVRVTLETCTRRPPVETKGWDSVVVVG